LRVTPQAIFVALVILILATPLFFVNDSLGAGVVTYKTFIFRVLVELALPLYLYLIITKPELRPRLKQPIALALIAYLVISLVAALTGIDPERSIWGNFERMGGVFTLLHLLLFFFYILLITQLDGHWQKRLVKVIVGVAAFTALNAVSAKLGLPTLGPDNSRTDRLASTLGNPDFFGSFLCIPLFLAIWLTFDAHKRAERWIYAGIAILCVFGIYLSGTRGAVVGVLAGAFVGAVIWLIFTANRRLRRYGLSIAGLGLVAIGGLFELAGNLSQNSLLHRIFSLSGSDTQARLLEWGTALQGFVSRPFLGVGPENYYYIADKFYNPATYSYDTGYFDKPHNLLLELLDTIGPLGLLAYMAVVIFAFWAFYRAYKSERVDLRAFALFVAALVAFEVQDLTAFDTIGPSLTFFTLLGIAGYMWKGTTTNPAVESARSRAMGKARRRLALLIMLPVTFVSAAAIYMANYAPQRIVTDLSVGQSLTASDPQGAANYYDEAITLPYNFDTAQTASSYANFASHYTLIATANEKQAALNELVQSIDFSTAATNSHPDDVTVWQWLAEEDDTYSGAAGMPIDPAAEAAARQAVALSNRPEAGQVLAAVLISEQKLSEARDTLLQVAQSYPKLASVAFLAAYVFHTQGDIATGVYWLNRALQDGYKVQAYADVEWAGDYYASRGEYSSEVAVYKNAHSSDPGDIDIAISLVNAYQRNGQYGQARALYEQIIAIDPSRAGQMPGVM
jgi:O-antigen ligase